MELQPLLGDLKDVVTYDGKYRVQLEIPKTSTLTSKDVERVLAISSWKTQPSKEAKGYEGIRSVTVDREHPIRKGNIELKGLQISGVGHRGFDNFKMLQDIPKVVNFYPPSKENFMDHVTGTKMSTTHAEGGRIITTRPGYRAMGTYTKPELKQKLKNTMEISNVSLEEMAVPHVEAYGRYLGDELRNDSGNFGFMVFPIPDAEKPRAANEFIQKLSTFPSKKSDPRNVVMASYYAMSPYLCCLVDGLRELHDKPRRVHLQTHLENFYLVDGIPYVMDWATMRKLGNDKEENILNRCIDVKRPADDYDSIFSTIFPQASRDMKSHMSTLIKEMVLEIYSKDNKKEIDLMPYVGRAERVLRRSPTDLEVIAQWMKDSGIENFRS
jgi:hypothetical protein